MSEQGQGATRQGQDAARGPRGHRHTPPGEHEHEFEATLGLPEPLPVGERLLWQGAPEVGPIALRAFHLRKVAIYFGLLLAWRGMSVASDGGSAAQVVAAMAWVLPLAGFALGTLYALAWLTARTALYTITSKRVVLRIGIVLTLTFNLPLRRIVAAGLYEDPSGRGDIPLTLAAADKIAWVHLWPHCRPWRLARPEPMLRGLPRVREVAQILARAWVAANELPAAAAANAMATTAAPSAAPVDAAAPAASAAIAATAATAEAAGLLARIRRGLRGRTSRELAATH